MSIFGQRARLPVTLQGGEGNDTLFVGANDLMLGGDGDDFANSVGGGADVITGDAGTDTVFVDASDTVSTVEFMTPGRQARRQRQDDHRRRGRPRGLRDVRSPIRAASLTGGALVAKPLTFYGAGATVGP